MDYVDQQEEATEQVPGFQKLRNGVRILLEDVSKRQQGLSFVVGSLLWKTLEMLEFPKQGYYDVVFMS